MRIRPALLIIALLSSHSALEAQSVTSTTQTADSYKSRIANLEVGETDIDYTSLRLAYSQLKDANPYGADHDIRAQMNVAVIEGHCDQALKIADSILKTIYLSPDTHAAMSNCFRVNGDNSKAELHKKIYLGLINSILAKGDGNTLETAYTVISIEEAFAVMRALGFAVWGQGYIHKDLHTFDVLSGTDEKNKRTAKVYFNVDIPLAIEKNRQAANR